MLCHNIETDRISFLGLAVHESYRRQGVASALITNLEELGSRCEARVISLFTVKETGNVEIFSRMGFKVVAAEPSVIFESDKFESLTEVQMEKSIRSILAPG